MPIVNGVGRPEHQANDDLFAPDPGERFGCACWR
jgi:hypothetical protein